MDGKGLTADIRGFSLVEILVAIAILGILVTIASTTFRELNEKYRVEAATKQLYVDLMDARGRAMQRNRVHFVRMTSSGYATYEDTNPAPDGNGILEGGADSPVTVARLSGTIAIASGLPGGALDFQFSRNGIGSTLGHVRLSSSVPGVHPDYDCLTIAETRIKMGQYNAAAGNCVEK